MRAQHRSPELVQLHTYLSERLRKEGAFTPPSITPHLSALDILIEAAGVEQIKEVVELALVDKWYRPRLLDGWYMFLRRHWHSMIDLKNKSAPSDKRTTYSTNQRTKKLTKMLPES